jgi:hypothetical protein
MEEIFHLARAWSPHDPPREQVWSQNRAEEEFDWYIEQAKLLGLSHSPIKRSMRTSKDEDGRDWLVHYYQRTYIKGEDREMQHLKDIFCMKCPPVYAELLP